MSKPLQIIIKRKVDGPSTPELGTPTSVTFDSITVPLVRPSTGPSAIASYSIERATSSGGPWTVAATGALIFGNPPTQYTDGGRTALTTYYYRALATDSTGRVSAYSATVSGTTTSLSPSAPVTLSLAAAGSSVNVGISALAPAGGRAITQYQVERSTNGTSWSSVATPDPVAASEIPAQDTRTPTKYVAASGTYNGNGAYTTLQAAFNAANPGDVIAVAPGTYAERAILTRSGTAAQPIYVRCADYNNRPTFDGQYSRSVVPGWDTVNGGIGLTQIFTIYANHVTVDGLNFIRTPEGGVLLGIGNTNGNFIFPSDVDTFYTGIRLIRCSVVGGETLLRTINVDGCDIIGCTFLDGQRAFYSPTGSPAERSWGANVLLMGKNINFIESVAGQSSGECFHAGNHGAYGGGDGFAHTQAANVVVRRCTFFDGWSTPCYLTNVDGLVFEQNRIYYTGDIRYWENTTYPHACLAIGSESGRRPYVAGSSVVGTNFFVGMRDAVIRNNIITGGLFGISFAEWQSQQTTRVKILNNTFYQTVGGSNAFEASLISNAESELTDITFKGNLVYDAVPAQMCRTWLTPGGTWSRGSNYFSTNPPATLLGSGDVIGGSPGMVNSAYTPGGTYPSVIPFDANQCKLQSGSQLANAGAVIGDVTNDFFGNPRPAYSGRYDIGAHSITKPLSITYSDAGLAAGTYYYRVRYVESGGAVSDWSNTVAVAV